MQRGIDYVPRTIRIVFTYPTRTGGARVCVAGVDAVGVTWRPEPRVGGVRRSAVRCASGETVRAIRKHRIEPPHIDDVD